jgi:RNA polymerase sigma-70 factor, ECF subfamily
MESSDQELLEQYMDGDVQALAVLMERHRRPLFAYILNMSRAQGDAEDIFQEVWLKVIRNAQQYRRGGFRAWVFQICHHLMIDRFRRQTHWVSLEMPQGTDDATLEDVLADRSATPDVTAGQQDEVRRIDAAMKALPPEQREVFLMRTQGEIPFREIARIQGVSINTALARMQYAVAKLRRQLADGQSKRRR